MTTITELNQLLESKQQHLQTLRQKLATQHPGTNLALELELESIAAAIQNLTLALREKAAPNQAINQAPSLPLHFVERAMIKSISKTLLTNTNTPLALTVLYGSSGLGKTTLATALAHNTKILTHFKDGILWGKLGPQAKEAHIEQIQLTWGKALGQNLQVYPTPKHKAQRLQELLKTKRCLLILDDVWPETDISNLVVTGNSSQLLITTHHKKVGQPYQATYFQIRPFSTNESLDLLSNWATINLHSNPQATELVKYLGNHPLSLAFIGNQLLERTNINQLLPIFNTQQDGVSTFGVDNVLSNEEILSLAFNLRFKQLPETAQSCFAHLSVFAANEPFEAKAVATVWHVTPNTLLHKAKYFLSRISGRKEKEEEKRADALLNLAEQQLRLLVGWGFLERVQNQNLTEIEERQNINLENRPIQFIIHPLLHHYARLHLPAPELSQAIHHHNSYYCHLAEQSPAHYTPIERNLGQIRAVWQRTLSAADETAFDLLEAMQPFFKQKGYWVEWIAWTKSALNIAQQMANRNKEAVLLKDMGHTLNHLGHKTEALTCFQQALDLQQQLDNKADIAINLISIGKIYGGKGEFDEALSYYQQALAFSQDLEDKTLLAIIFNNIGAIYKVKGEVDEALSYFKQALAIDKTLDNKAGVAVDLNNIGSIYQAKEDLDQALSHYQQALDIGQQLGNKTAVAIRLNNIGDIYRIKGDVTAAFSHYQQALEIFEALGDRAKRATVLNNIGEIYRLKKEFTAAMAHFQQALAIDRTLNNKPNMAVELMNIGILYLGQKQLTKAKTALEEAADLFEGIGSSEAVVLRKWIMALNNKNKP